MNDHGRRTIWSTKNSGFNREHPLFILSCFNDGNGEGVMKFIVIAIASLVVSAAGFAPAYATHRHYRMHHYSAARDYPNGTAGGPTTLSGTGSSQFGGSTPGVTGKN